MIAALICALIGLFLALGLPGAWSLFAAPFAMLGVWFMSGHPARLLAEHAHRRDHPKGRARR